MPTTRIRTRRAPGAGGGGGGGSGTVTWGPDFGEHAGNDGVTFNAAATATLPAVGLLNTRTVGVTATMPAVAMANTETVGAHLSGTALGAPFWQSEGHAAGSSASQVVIPKPAGLAVGDFMLAFVGTSAAVGTPNVNVPSGWAGGTPQNNAGAVFAQLRGFSKVADAADVAATNFTFTFTASADEFAGEIHRMIGVDAALGTVTSAAGATGVGNPPDPPAPAITTSNVNALIFATLWHSHLALSQTHTPPGGHDERTDYQATLDAVTMGMTTSTRVFAATGVQAAVTVDCTETVNTDWITMRVAIYPATLVLAP